jgi:hypothetical protein
MLCYVMAIDATTCEHTHMNMHKGMIGALCSAKECHHTARLEKDESRMVTLASLEAEVKYTRGRKHMCKMIRFKCGLSTV